MALPDTKGKKSRARAGLGGNRSIEEHLLAREEVGIYRLREPRLGDCGKEDRRIRADKRRGDVAYCQQGGAEHLSR